MTENDINEVDNMFTCKDCVHFKVFATGKRGGEKGACQYSKKCIYNHSKACLSHFKKIER